MPSSIQERVVVIVILLILTGIAIGFPWWADARCKTLYGPDAKVSLAVRYACIVDNTLKPID